MGSYLHVEPLTKRERQVLAMVASGKRNVEIAQALNVTLRTVKFHTGNIYSKLGLRSRSEAIVWAWERHQPTGGLPDQATPVPRYIAGFPRRGRV